MMVRETKAMIKQNKTEEPEDIEEKQKTKKDDGEEIKEQKNNKKRYKKEEEEKNEISRRLQTQINKRKPDELRHSEKAEELGYLLKLTDLSDAVVFHSRNVAKGRQRELCNKSMEIEE